MSTELFKTPEELLEIENRKKQRWLLNFGVDNLDSVS